MRNDQEDFGAIQTAAEKCEVIAGLERALDLSYRRLVRAARSQWEHVFASGDASDACVTVRIHTTNGHAASVAGSGFLKPRQAASPKTNLPLPRLAR
jgi:hypothetical protein